MKRLLYIVILFMTATNILAQSFKVRECTEAELPRSKRDRYFIQTTQFLNNYYMHLLNLEDNIILENFVRLVYSDKDAATLIPEFNRNGISSVRMTPKQYLLELKKMLSGLDRDELDFKVNNVTPGKILMNSLVSCYIPIEYDLTLMEGDKILFKRRCLMHGYFEDIRNYMDVKLKQIEPIKDVIVYEPQGEEVLKDEKVKKIKETLTYTNVKGVITEKSDLKDSFEDNRQKDNQLHKCIGQVFDGKENVPLVGCAINIKSNDYYGTISDFDGEFDLGQIKTGETVIFRFIGYKTQKIKWNGEFLKVIMKEK